MVHWVEVGITTGSLALSLCATVFGKDDGESDFVFSPQMIDNLVAFWSFVVRGQGFAAKYKPSRDYIAVLELCVSDDRKQLLLANSKFIP